jgi:starvation-inducible outer membrane lipoprotein
MKTALTIACGALALAACATVPADGEPPAREPADTCQREPGQRFIGQRATADLGAAIMAATHSTRIRWVPPRTAVTMEYAFGRVTVSYDDDYRITVVSCS